MIRGRVSTKTLDDNRGCGWRAMEALFVLERFLLLGSRYSLSIHVTYVVYGGVPGIMRMGLELQYWRYRIANIIVL